MKYQSEIQEYQAKERVEGLINVKEKNEANFKIFFLTRTAMARRRWYGGGSPVFEDRPTVMFPLSPSLESGR